MLALIRWPDKQKGQASIGGSEGNWQWQCPRLNTDYLSVFSDRPISYLNTGPDLDFT